MAINWPATVNFKIAGEYRRNEKLPIVEEENDLGVPSRLRIGSMPIISHTFTLYLTKEEFKDLSAWVRDKLYCGVLSFYFNDPIYGELKTGQFALQDGAWYSELQYSRSGIKISVEITETIE